MKPKIIVRNQAIMRSCCREVRGLVDRLVGGGLGAFFPRTRNCLLRSSHFADRRPRAAVKGGPQATA
jgi:hypothetical protein